jgi:phosphate starvation-inducible PhoH-like protein
LSNKSSKDISKKKQSEIILNLPGNAPLDILGLNNTKLKLVKQAFPDVQISSRGNAVRINGPKRRAQDVKAVFEIMIHILQKEGELTINAVNDLLNGHNPYDTLLSEDRSAVIVHGRNGKSVKARTKNQKLLVEQCNNNDIVFAVGPAGTGKTYTAVALAVRALKMRLVKKIILTRPAVEAGESLGFLPGDLRDKVDPYLRPLYDALDDMIPGEKLRQFMADRVIEVAPLAFMRGRTLDNAFIILDEAQNATTLQLKMFLTRIGPSAKCIITGDLSQIDLPFHQKSGLSRSINLLKHIRGIGVVRLTAEDVVRHRLVKEIIKVYDRNASERKRKLEEE